MRTKSICLALAIVLLSPFASAQWVPTNGPNGVDIRCVAPSGPNLFAGTYGNGVYLSTNNGASWTAFNTDLPPYRYINTLAVDGANLYAGTVSGVFVSTDNGTSWSAGTGMTGTNLFAGTWDTGVFISTNNGASWTAVNTGLTMLIVFSLAVSGTNLFVGLDERAGVFRSTNNGTSWTAARTGLTNGYIFSLAINGTNLFAGTYEGVFLSTDNGTSWTMVNSGVPVDSHGDYPRVPALAVSGTNVFAGTYGNGVFLSTNNGISWTPVNTGLPFPYIDNLAVDDANLYCGSNGMGVWFRPLSEMVTTSVSEPSCDLPTMFGLQQNYPNPFNAGTTIRFDLPHASKVSLKVYSVLGQEVTTLVEEEKSAGTYNVQFSAASLSSGMYVYRLQAGEYVAEKKLVLLK
jgi:ligand-binding sensor domain-containing protein